MARTRTPATIRCRSTPGAAAPSVTHFCWSHARRPFFKLADVETAAMKRSQGKTDAVLSPLAFEAVRRIDAIFDIERAINRRALTKDLPSARRRSRLSSIALKNGCVHAKISKHNDVAKAIDYMLWRCHGGGAPGGGAPHRG